MTDIPKSPRPDLIAKVCRFGERFWVDQISRMEDGRFVGKVANDLLTDELHFGDRIEFEEHEVFDVTTVEMMKAKVRRWKRTGVPPT